MAVSEAHLLADLGHRGLGQRPEPLGAGLEDPVDLVRVRQQLAGSARGPAA